MKKQLYISILLCLMVCSCEKNILVPAEEPEITPSEESIITQDIIITIEDKTDHDLYIKWYPVVNAESYEIIVNNMYVISDDITKEDYSSYYLYKLTNLEADSEYEIGVRAVSKDLHTKTATTKARTRKSFIARAILVELDKYTYDFKGFTHYAPTSDGGHLFIANINKEISYKILMKLDTDYETEWLCEIPEPGYEPYYFYTEPHLRIYEVSDGNYLITTDKEVIKVSTAGILMWRTKINDESSYIRSSTVLPDESIMLFGVTNSSTFYGYCIAKVDANGSLLWEKNLIIPENQHRQGYLTYGLYHQERILCSTNDDVFSLLEFDTDGNILNKYVYEYSPGNKITFSAIQPSDDGNFYLLGNAFYKYYFLKINGEGTAIWKRVGHDEDANYGSILGYNITAQQALLSLEVERDWVIVRELDTFGNFTETLSWYGAPSNIYIGKDENGRYVYVTMYGQILFLNPDGYQSRT